MREMPTGSTWDRAEKCPASHVLPRVTEGERGFWTGRGDAVHEFSANCTVMDREDALAKVPDEWKETCAAVDFGIDLRGFSAEVTFVVNLATGEAREVCRGKRPDHVELAPFETRLTVDLVGIAVIDNVRYVYVLDWKTGYMAVRSAEQNLQIGLGAYAASVVYGAEYAKVAIGYVKEGTTPYFDWASHDSFDLADILSRCKTTFMNISKAADVVAKGVTPDVVTGSHCRHCPAFQHCPAQTQMVRAAFAMPNAAADDIKGALTPERAASAYKQLKILKQAVRHVENALHAYAEENPIDLGDGTVYGPAPGNELVQDQEKAKEVLMELTKSVDTMGLLNTARGWSTSKGQIEKVLKKNTEPAIEALRKAGAVFAKNEVREHKKKPSTGGGK